MNPHRTRYKTSKSPRKKKTMIGSKGAVIRDENAVKRWRLVSGTRVLRRVTMRCASTCVALVIWTNPERGNLEISIQYFEIPKTQFANLVLKISERTGTRPRPGSRSGFYIWYLFAFTPRSDSTWKELSRIHGTNLQHHIQASQLAPGSPAFTGECDCNCNYNGGEPLGGLEERSTIVKPSRGYDALVQLVLYSGKKNLQIVMRCPDPGGIGPGLSFITCLCVVDVVASVTFRLRALLLESLAPCVYPLKGRLRLVGH